MLIGNIIDIKHLAVHDGPGIRTTFFFKGCPLRCRWCHNPESQGAAPELGLLQHRCIKCRKCAAICSLHTFDAEGNHHIDRARCIHCNKCVENCPVNALERYGRTIPLEEAFAEAMRDESFYRANSGGVTVSGGEPLLQSDFVYALLEKLHQHSIHTAVDSCGAVPWSSFEKVLPVTDLFLFDLKHPDPAEHLRATGMTNTLLLENLQKLDKNAKPVEIRIPLIPGYNNTAEALAGFANIISGLHNVTSVSVLPFHRARFKYQAIGQSEPLEDLEPCTVAEADAVRDFFRKNNINVSDN